MGLIFCFFISLFSFYGLTQEVISSQGESYSNLNGSIDFTLGEVVINTTSSANATLTQGFHQTKWNFLGLEDYNSSFFISLYPNPISDILYITSKTDKILIAELFDANGKLVLKSSITGPNAQMSVKNIAPGYYSLLLMDKESVVKLFKLIKTQ